MKTSLRWLRTYLPDAPNAQACGDALTMGGLPVEVFETYEGDDVFDVEVTSNRSDCLSHVGVARELSALLNLPVAHPPIDVPPLTTSTSAATAPALPITVEDPAACPLYTARIIRGVKIAPSPAWLQRDLLAVGLRPINNIVDITNFVLLEMGQPLHAFDLARLAGPAIHVRRARQGEELVSIDGHTRKLEPWMLVIADASAPAALAGIMGGKHSEVSDQTTDILLESAIFDPLTVRRTSRHLALRSDSSYRFERGIDPTLPARASARAARLILELAGGKLDTALVSVPPADPLPQKKLSLPLARITRLLGYHISPDDALSALTRLGFQPRLEADTLRVLVPPHRLDINIEVDLVEEIARVTGYDRIPQRDTIEVRAAPADPDARSMNLIADVLTGSGYFEAITFSFVTDALADDFIPPTATGLPRADHGTRKADARLRPSLLPGLLEALARNESAGNGAVKLYEVGSAFHLAAGAKLVESRKLALTGGDTHTLRGVLEATLARLDARRPFRVEPAKCPGFDVAAHVVWGDERVGHLGLIAKSIVKKLDLRHTPVAAELDLAPLYAGTRHVPQLSPLPKYPAIERDVSLVVTEDLPYNTLADLVASLNLPHLESAHHLTTYRGKPLDKGVKSVSIRLHFRSPDRSLKAEEVDQAMTTFIEAAKSRTGATLRT